MPIPIYEPSNRLAQIASRVMATHEAVQHLDDPQCRIAYQTSDEAKHKGTRLVYADTERIKAKYKAWMPYDFLITFYWPNCEYLSDEKLEQLMYHELLHVGFFDDGTFVLLPHDIEDFRDVVDRWGLDWL